MGEAEDKKGEAEDKNRGFTVVDRRQEEGEDSPEAPSPETVPRVDFATFVLSLGTSALYHLGIVGDPESGETQAEPNLPLARQTIDALEMLQGKTLGNLDAEETKLLESLLYELHMRFVEAGKAPE